MHQLRTTLAAGISIAALSLTGCSGGTSSGTSTPSETSSAPTSEAQGPEIANPKDLAAIKDACQLLRPEQAQQLGAGTTPKPGKPSPWGSTCGWEQGDIEVSFTPDVVQGKGLENVLANTNKATPDGQVDGYPFVENSSTSISCGLYFAPSDKQTLIVTTFTDSDSPTPPCELAKQAAGMVLSNLPPMK